MCINLVRYSTGFYIEGGGGPGIPPPEILKLRVCYYISYLHVTEQNYVSQNVVWKVCPRLHQKQDVNSKLYFVRFAACATGNISFCYHPVPPPPHLKILYETLQYV